MVDDEEGTVVEQKRKKLKVKEEVELMRSSKQRLRSCKRNRWRRRGNMGKGVLEQGRRGRNGSKRKRKGKMRKRNREQE